MYCSLLFSIFVKCISLHVFAYLSRNLFFLSIKKRTMQQKWYTKFALCSLNKKNGEDLITVIKTSKSVWLLIHIYSKKYPPRRMHFRHENHDHIVIKVGQLIG